MDRKQGFRTTSQQRHAALKNFDSFELPEKRFGDDVANYTHEARELAATIRSQCVPRLGRLAVAEAIVEASGWNMNYRDITKVGSQEPSTVRSLLIPLLEGGFSVVINTLHDPDTNRCAALIAHEVGHSFFYNHSVKPPLRITLGMADEAEEQFCDAFAHGVTDIRL